MTATAASGAAPASSGGGGMAPAAIKVLVWNYAAGSFSHAARVTALPLFLARETTDNIKFDTRYADASDTGTSTSDVSVFTDAGLDAYDVVMFLNTSGNTLDQDAQATGVHRQALIDFMKKGRGFVGVHAAADTYQGTTWPWYVDFLGANMAGHSNAGTMGTAMAYPGARHPILTAANTPQPWTRNEEWLTFTRNLLASPPAGFTILLTCTDVAMTTERAITWVHEMPPETGTPRVGRMFYTGLGHQLSAYQEPAVMDLIVAGIKWAAYRL